MDFYEVVRQAAKLLQQQDRMTYRTLKRQFNLDDEALEDLKEELIYGQRLAIDENGRILVWTGDPAVPESEVSRESDIEVRFHAILPVLTMLLSREGQVTYRTLIRVFALDEALLNDIREELAFRGQAIDKDGKGLIWTGGAQAIGMLASPDATSTDVSSEDPADTPESSHTVPDAERRQLTVMFCDLADSTKLSQQLDPEDFREVVRAYQATAAEVIQQYEGYIAQYLGDGLLIYFGWPVAHEDDAQRAMYAGLGIVEAIITNLNPRLKTEKGIPLTVRLGVHTGPVVMGEMGGGGRMENLATGETVNIAARLEGLAASNTVVISGVTERLVRRAFVLHDLGPQVLKGVAEPMQAFRVIGPMDDNDDDKTTVSPPFLVGRDEEVGLLLRRWEQSKEGLGQVVLIRGEAGIGKSSLLATVRQQVVQEGYTRMTVRCSPYHTNSALYPVIEHVQRVLQFQPGDTPATRLDKLAGVLSGYSRPLNEVMPLFAALLSVPLPEGRDAPLNLTPQQQRQQTQDALVGWLLEEAERRPTLVTWEDLQWADPSTLEYLGVILEQTPTAPILHVLTYRPEFEPPWPTRSHMTPISLNRLEGLQVEALITKLTDNKMLPDEVVQHIVAKTDGVPLYVEELTKMLLESRLLRTESDRYVLTEPLLAVAIPDTLQDSLMARLDQLGVAKEVAQLGAVLGREFTYEMLLAISSQDEKTLQAGLSQLVASELLYQRGRPPRARYIFKHALIQDAAYASLLRNTRQQIHQRIAQRFEERFPETVATQPELMAHHYTEANCPQQALPYWQRAGEHAAQRSAYAEAMAHLRQGLDLLTLLPDTPQRLQQELALQVALGPALIATKGHADPEVEHAYARAQELCQQVGDTSMLFPVLRGLTLYNMIRGQFQTAHRLGTQLLHLAESQQEPAPLMAGHFQLGVVLLWRGEPAAAQAHHTQVLATSTPQAHRDLVLRYGIELEEASQSHLALELWQLGYPEQALRRIQTACTLAQEASHAYSLALTLLIAAVLYQCCNDARATHVHAETVATLAAEQGLAVWSAWGTVLHGWALAMQGQHEAGIVEMRQGLADDLDLGGKMMQPYFLGLLASASSKHGQPAAALPLIEEALAMMEETEARFYGSELYRLKGTLLLQQAVPDVSQAVTCFHKALAVARHQQAKSWELRAATSLARLWQSQGKRQAAYDLLAPVYNWFTEGLDTSDLKDASALLQELEG